MSKFKVGDNVQLRKSSGNYHKDNSPYGDNPIKTKGVITENDGSDYRPLSVEWSNGSSNWYYPEDLKLWKDKSVKEIEITYIDPSLMHCAEIPIIGEQYEVINTDVFASWVKVGDIFTLVRKSRSDSYVIDKEDKLPEQIEQWVPSSSFFIYLKKVEAIDKPITEFVVGKEYRIVNEDYSHVFSKGDIVKYVDNSPYSGLPRFVRDDGLRQDLDNIDFEEVETEVPTPTATGWIEWKGGEMPVPLGTLVDVKHRDGEEFYGVKAGVRGSNAEYWVYQRIGSPGNLVAYRLHVSQDAVKAPSEAITDTSSEKACDGMGQTQSPSNASTDGFLVVGDKYEVIKTGYGSGWFFDMGDIVTYIGNGTFEGDKYPQYLLGCDLVNIKDLVKKVDSCNPLDEPDSDLFKTIADKIKSVLTTSLEGKPYNPLSGMFIDNVWVGEVGHITLPQIDLKSDTIEEDRQKPQEKGDDPEVSITEYYNLDIGSLDLNQLTYEQLYSIYEKIEEVL